MKQFLVENDFLFGLSEDSWLHSTVMEVLRLNQVGAIKVYVSSASPMEVFLVLASRGFELETVAKALKLMRLKLEEYEANRYCATSLKSLQFAAELRMRYPKLTFFDSIHTSLALTMGYPLLTSEEVLRRIVASEGGVARDVNEVL